MSDSVINAQEAAIGTITVPRLGDPCQRCRKRPSTTNWVGEGGWLAQTHGFSQLWCDVCVLAEQLKYARKLARKIPSIERKLAKAKARAASLKTAR